MPKRAAVFPDRSDDRRREDPRFGGGIVSAEPNDPIARALSLFERYVDLPQPSLADALAELQRSEPETCIALLRLLAADARTYSFASPLRWFTALDDDAREDERAALKIWPDGTRLGPWRIDGIIGVGGMGVIYAAHRADGLYEREVALKTVRPELMSPALRDAFAKERSHLARLEHPSIVALHDAGVENDEQPWIAMQRVRGEPIDVWCDARNADLRTRVRLLIQVCDAVAYAHAHGVLHQDVKPSNLLVNEDGNVKLLDFGLSALRSPHADDAFARVGVSSAYAAPEIFDRAPPSVAIDTYALGVVLYRLLCDDWPYAPMTMAIPLRSLGAEDVAARASERASLCSEDAARKRGYRDVRALSRALKGDLDAIALRCVHRDPVARYAAVVDIRDDLRSWLDRRPVEARGGDWRYRASRFVGRNALATASTVLVLAAALAMGGALLRQRARADMAAENDAILSRLFEESLRVATLRSLGDAPQSSQALLDDAEHRLRADAGRDRPQFLARGLMALARAYALRSEFDRAERLLLESKALSQSDPMLNAKRNALLANLTNKRSKWIDAERLASEGLSILQTIEGEDADLTRVELNFQWARSRWLRGDTAGALRILDRTIDAARRLGERARPSLASLLRQRGSVRAGIDQFDAAERDLRESLSLLNDESPLILNQTRQTLALLRAAEGDAAGAHALAATALIGTIDVYGVSHVETGRAWLTIAKTWRACRSDRRRARIALQRAETIMVARVGAEHPLLEEVFGMRAALEIEHGEHTAAVAYARRATAIALRTQGRNETAIFRRKNDLALLLAIAAQASDRALRPALYREADALLASAIDDGERTGERIGDLYANRVGPLLFLGRIDEAERHARIARGAAATPKQSEIDRHNAEFATLRVRWSQGHREEASVRLASLRRKLASSGGRLDMRGDMRFIAHTLIARTAILGADFSAE